jgi:hypothetical protein
VLDYLAYQMAQRQVADLAHGALPDSPMRPSEISGTCVPPRLRERVRTATADLLRHLADRCDVPMPAGWQSEQGAAIRRDVRSQRPCRSTLDPINA